MAPRCAAGYPGGAPRNVRQGNENGVAGYRAAMPTAILEAVDAGDGADELIAKLRRLVSGNPFREHGPGRWRIQLNDAGSGAEAQAAVEAELDTLADGREWRSRLRVIGSDGG